MKKQDVDLVKLYWELQRKAHYDPDARKAALDLTALLRKKKIGSTAVNDIGLSMEQ